MEQFLLRTYDGEHALTRVEWSKGWAYTDEAVWSDAEVLDTAIPASFGESTWGQAAGTLDRLDPNRVLGNTFLDRLLR